MKQSQHQNHGHEFIEYLEVVYNEIKKQTDSITHLFSLMQKAKNIHIYGFGRSGSAALAFAIRLRHFAEYLPPVWWVGDQVRTPINTGDLLILFSSKGEREEIRIVAQKARTRQADIVLITQNQYSAIHEMSKIAIILPGMSQTFVYGGGDFELAAYFMQELLVTEYGVMNAIPKSDIEKYHV